MKYSEPLVAPELSAKFQQSAITRFTENQVMIALSAAEVPRGLSRQPEQNFLDFVDENVVAMQQMTDIRVVPLERSRYSRHRHPRAIRITL